MQSQRKSQNGTISGTLVKFPGSREETLDLIFRRAQRPSLHTSMASLFANALRTQVRVALLASRARVVPKAASLFGLGARSSTSSFPRSLSSSRVVLAEYGYGGPPNPTKTLYVGNMPYSTDEGELQDVLSQFGNVEVIRFGELLFLHASLGQLYSCSTLCTRSPTGWNFQGLCSC